VKRCRADLLLEPQGGEVNTNEWSYVCKRVATLDSGVFPQELKKRFFRFSLLPAGELEIRELDREPRLSFPSSDVTCQCLRVPDGMTNSIRVPYHSDNMHGDRLRVLHSAISD
jgi:hypothetical protein